jgi:catechol 2,3-dioxygenase-like lactoylglutathione lyase family enzyme
MLDHVTLGVSDIERSQAFYDSALPPLGIERLCADGDGAAGYGANGKAFFWIGRKAVSQTGAHAPSSPRTGKPSTGFTRQRSPPTAGITERRGCARIITLTITGPSFSIRMATTSRLFAMGKSTNPISRPLHFPDRP